MKFLFMLTFALFASEAYSKTFKCPQKEIKKSLGFFIAVDTTPPPAKPQVLKVQGKNLTVKEKTETYKLTSKVPVLDSSVVDEIITVEDEVKVYKNGEFVKKDPPDLALMFKLNDSGRKKLSDATAANIGKLLVVKVGKEILFLPSIYSKISGPSFVIGMPDFESAYVKLKAVCSSEPVELNP